jgi:hypothetical protein
MAKKERFELSLKGMWRDKYEWVSGPNEGKIVETGWKPNQIQNSATYLVAGLFARRGEDPTSAPSGWNGLRGISYLAVGTGDTSWEVSPPTQNPADTSLYNEYFRKELSFTNLGYIATGLDPGSPTVLGPTTKIQTTCLFTPSEANGSMREFALFGGLADEDTDSGFMINWVVHPLIVKDSSLIITRTIEIEFLLP